jgi:pimeloyl-ACP methyl ester carboxylesterase
MRAGKTPLTARTLRRYADAMIGRGTAEGATCARSLGGIAFAALLALLGGPGCTVAFGQRNIFPARTERLPPMPEGLTRTNVELVVDEGVTIRGWHLHKPGSRRVALFFHGNGAGIQSSAWALHWLAMALDADVVAFDDRGYGFSDGPPSLDAIVEDALRIHGFVGQELGLRDRPLVVIGESMGTAPAIHLAAHRRVDALIVISPFSSYQDLVAAVRRSTPWYVRVTPDASLLGLRAAPLADLASVTATTLIVHGTRDELTTPDVVHRVEAACASARKLVCAFDGTHGDAHPGNPTVRACIERFEKTLAATAPFERD